jgi:hypothetical protein
MMCVMRADHLVRVMLHRITLAQNDTLPFYLLPSEEVFENAILQLFCVDFLVYCVGGLKVLTSIYVN